MPCGKYRRYLNSPIEIFMAIFPVCLSRASFRGVKLLWSHPRCRLRSDVFDAEMFLRTNYGYGCMWIDRNTFFSSRNNLVEYVRFIIIFTFTQLLFYSLYSFHSFIQILLLNYFFHWIEKLEFNTIQITMKNTTFIQNMDAADLESKKKDTE